MASSDAFVIGEDWISEHYFTTDAKSQSFQARVLERRRAWDETGDGLPTVRSRFTAARARLESTLAVVLAGESNGDGLPELYAELRQILGYDPREYLLKSEGPVTHVSAPEISVGAPLAIIDARAVETVEDLLVREADNLLSPYVADEKTTLTSAARLLSRLLGSGDGPEFALVMAGRWLLVAERVRWQEGRYLAVDLQLVCERNDVKRGGEIDRALTCTGAESLAPDVDGGIWWHQVLDDSVKHTVGVSQDLREGVRLSIEIIANEVVNRRRTQGLDPLPQHQAQPLARQALRYLYRILFLLYAEASPELEVLPIGTGEYEAGYGLDRLRELTLVELASPRAAGGTHLYDSLALLFRLVDQGHPAKPARDGEPPGPRIPEPASRPLPAQGNGAHRPDRPGQRRLAAGTAPPAAQQGIQGKGPGLHLLRRARHQPARRGVRGPDVLHGFLRRNRPVRGSQGRRCLERFLGRAGRARRQHRRERLCPR